MNHPSELVLSQRCRKRLPPIRQLIIYSFMTSVSSLRRLQPDAATARASQAPRSTLAVRMMRSAIRRLVSHSADSLAVVVVQEGVVVTQASDRSVTTCRFTFLLGEDDGGGLF